MLTRVKTPQKLMCVYVCVFNNRGDGALELLAMDLKVRGLFVSRHLENGLDLPQIRPLQGMS